RRDLVIYLALLIAELVPRTAAESLGHDAGARCDDSRPMIFLMRMDRLKWGHSPFLLLQVGSRNETQPCALMLRALLRTWSRRNLRRSTSPAHPHRPARARSRSSSARTLLQPGN